MATGRKGRTCSAKADGVVLFVSEGAKWIGIESGAAEPPLRIWPSAAAAWRCCTGAWAPSRPSTSIPSWPCRRLPRRTDRKYKFLETAVQVAADDHPITKGLADFRIEEEFYYQLKQLPEAKLVPLLTAEIDGERPMVSWAWERPDGGRSFGFSGCHYHKNWDRPEYRRFISQAVLWTLEADAAREGLPRRSEGRATRLPE